MDNRDSIAQAFLESTGQISLLSIPLFFYSTGMCFPKRNGLEIRVSLNSEMAVGMLRGGQT